MSYTIGTTTTDWTTVSGILSSANITVIPDYANITAIVLPSTVTEIAADTFTLGTTRYCPLLTSITMPGVTKIGTNAFRTYTSLTGVLDAPELLTVGNDAFNGCNKLTSITMPKINTIGNSAFYGCSVLQLTDVFATSIGDSAFNSCSAITSITLRKMVSMPDRLFKDCAGLVSVSMPQFAGRLPDEAFNSCSKLTIVPDVSRATEIGVGAFQECNELVSISLPFATTLDIYAFAMCNKLVSISLPLATNIGVNAFFSCPTLQSVYMPKILTIGYGAFSEAFALKYLHINSGITITTDPSIFLGTAQMNDFHIITDNKLILSNKLNALLINTSNLNASRIYMEYDPTSTTTKSLAGDIVIMETITATQYGDLLTLFTGLEPSTPGIHKTIYDNLNALKATGLLLTSLNAHSELDALYSNISFDLAPHYKKFNTYINTVSAGATTQPNTTELIMTFTNGTFSKRLVYKLNK